MAHAPTPALKNLGPSYAREPPRGGSSKLIVKSSLPRRNQGWA